MATDTPHPPASTRTSSPYERNYQRLEAVLGRPVRKLRIGIAYRLRAPGFMDLVVEVLSRNPSTMVLSLAHYFEQNGDLCQDPEMEVRVYLPRGDQPGRVEALTFQQAIPPIYSVVYPEPGKAVSSTTGAGRLASV
jgi:hypothetical protein